MKGLNHVLAGGGETYVGWHPRVGILWTGGGLTWVKEEVDDVDEADEQEENTESLSELELPEDVECFG
jgi:hypothetical protein